jgi:hypothetical protein
LAAVLASTGHAAAQAPCIALKTLYTFQAPPHGSEPSVVIGGDGVLYGATTVGGRYYGGTIFSLVPPETPGGAWVETVPYNFTGGSDGSDPTDLVMGGDRVLYGTTGEPSSHTTIFSLSPPTSTGSAWIFKVVYTFSGGSDGFAAEPGLIIGEHGVLYGTTASGGASSEGAGSVFSLAPPTSTEGSWNYTLLYGFSLLNSVPGQDPLAGVVIGKGGVLYGTTFGGGTWGSGTVFSLTPPTSPGGPWTEAVLHAFAPFPFSPGDGLNPYASLVIGEDGVIFGTTYMGGTSGLNEGTTFSLTPPASPGGIWTETILHNFQGSDGENPSTLVSSGGILYGCARGGPLGNGVVYSLSPTTAGGPWMESLYAFSGGSDGSLPRTLLPSKGGVLYGSTIYGAAGGGTVFAIRP